MLELELKPRSFWHITPTNSIITFWYHSTDNTALQRKRKKKPTRDSLVSKTVVIYHLPMAATRIAGKALCKNTSLFREIAASHNKLGSTRKFWEGFRKEVRLEFCFEFKHWTDNGLERVSLRTSGCHVWSLQKVERLVCWSHRAKPLDGDGRSLGF